MPNAGAGEGLHHENVRSVIQGHRRDPVTRSLCSFPDRHLSQAAKSFDRCDLIDPLLPYFSVCEKDGRRGDRRGTQARVGLEPDP